MITAAGIIAYLVLGSATGTWAQHAHDKHGLDCVDSNCGPYFLLGVIWPIYWSFILWLVVPVKATAKLLRRRDEKMPPAAKVVER